jgi:glycosyltransferase involved in cell wall biosynthesis
MEGCLTDGSGKLRALLVIEQCNPEWPSVPLVGYKFYRHLAELAEVTLVTHVRNERALRTLHPDADIVIIQESAVLAGWHRIATWLSTIRGNTIWPLYHALTYPTYWEFDRQVLRQLGARITRGDFDVVHAITPMLPRYPYSVRKACGRTPLVIGPVNGGVPYPASFGNIAKSEFSFLNWLRTAGRYLLSGYRETYERADYVFSGSEFTKTLLEQLFTLKRPVEVLAENGLDDAFFSDAAGDRPPRDGDRVEMLFVGRLVPYKGTDIAIDALASLPPHLQQRARLTIVGDGPERALLETKAQEAGVSHLVRFAGWVPQRQTLDYYRSADVFCFPSVREFGGAVVLEAMANRLPCIVVNNGGVAEYVTDASGFKVEPLSREHVVAEVARALKTMIEDDGLRRAMGAAAGQRARDYAWSGKARRIVETYRGLVEERHPRQGVSRGSVA